MTIPKRALKQLGKKPDAHIAEQYGVSREAVSKRRRAANIPVAVRETPNALQPRVDVESEPDITYLSKIPLTGRQRKLMTDTRLALGLTQTDLAERAGCSPIMVVYVETGKKSPSPTLLTTLLKVLKLKLNVSLHIAVTHEE